MTANASPKAAGTEAQYTRRNLTIFSLSVLGLAILAGVIEPFTVPPAAEPGTPGLGQLLWLVTPLAVVLLLRLLRGNDLEREVLAYADDRTIELMRRYDIEGDCIHADAFRGDTARSELLVALGWEADNELPYVLNRTAINPIEVPALPDGYAFQSANGIEDAPFLAEAHNAAFGPIWTPECIGK